MPEQFTYNEISALAETLSAQLHEVKSKNSALSTRVVYEALRYYQKQGLFDPKDYNDLENALKALA